MSTNNVYVKGSKVWIPHATKVWEVATIVEDYSPAEPRLVVQTDDSRETKELDLQSDLPPPLCEPRDLAISCEANLDTLTAPSEASLLHLLRARFLDRSVYNRCGIAMLVVNPYAEVAPVDVASYREQTDREPHVFDVAERAFRRLEREQRDQSVVFSGESGAGKTENALRAILYLVTMGTTEEQVKDKILASSTILQAFGNAKTARNDNSSRFGTFIEMQYDKGYEIIGASLKVYLLDRSRAVCQAANERTFHIFHQLYAAKQRFPNLFREGKQFSKLNPETKDLRGFDETTRAIDDLGFSIKHRDEMLSLLSAILHLSNLTFKKSEGHENAESCFISELGHLEDVARILHLDAKAPTELRKWLCHKRVVCQQDEIVQPMSVEQAAKARDATVKFVYAKLFGWIVARVNALFRSPCNVQRSIGILDLYGFESLRANSFEQFCINYANEKMQQFFAQSVMKLEQEEYAREEIGWSFVEYRDNGSCLELIEGRNGIVEVIDEESKIPKDSAVPWVERLYSKCAKEQEDDSSRFRIHHFVDTVVYDASEFLEKNRDYPNRELIGVLKDTTNDLLRKMAVDEHSKVANAKTKRHTVIRRSRSSMGSKLLRKTTIAEFQSSLAQLTSTLEKTTPHYVRCIKSNDEKKPFEFDAACVAKQLRAFKVLDTIRISARGFFNRQTYANFFQRYYCLRDFDGKRDDLQEVCRDIVSKSVGRSDSVRFGKTKVFLRDQPVERLEQLRGEKRLKACVFIQKNVRRHLQRKHFEKVRRSVLLLQRQARSYLAHRRSRLQLEDQAASKIQACARGWLKRRWYRHLRSTSLTLRRYEELESERKQLASLQQQIVSSAAIEIQRLARGYLARRECARRLRDIVLVQSCVRRFLAKIACANLKRSRDERVKLLNMGLEKNIDELQQKINHLTRQHLTSSELEQMATIVDDQISSQTKNRMLSNVLLKKIETLKGLREQHQRKVEVPRIERNGRFVYPPISENACCRTLAEESRSQSTSHEQRISQAHQTLAQAFKQFNEGAEELRRALHASNQSCSDEESADSQRVEDETREMQEKYKRKIRRIMSDLENDTYEGTLQVHAVDVELLMHRLVKGLDPRVLIEQELPTELPADLLFRCIRYADSTDDRPLLLSLFESYLKAVKVTVKLRNELETTVVWIVNTHRLLNYLQQFSKPTVIDVEEEKLLRNLNYTQQRASLEETCYWLTSKAVRLVKESVLELVVPALLESTVASPLEQAPDQESPLGRLLDELLKFHKILKAFKINRVIGVQMFKKIFEFLNSIALSNVMRRKELCNRTRGTLIRCSLRHVERWATDHQLDIAFDQLLPSIHATRLLQMQPIQMGDIGVISRNLNKLNHNQILKLLSLCDTDESPISESVLDSLRVKLEERDELNDTILVHENLLNNLIILPFEWSDTSFEDIEIPEVLNLSMLKKVQSGDLSTLVPE